MDNIADQINQIINSNNNNTQNDFRPVRVGAKNTFIGRILPLEQGQFPFAQYYQAWISYTNKQGQTSPLRVIINPKDSNDELGKILQDVVHFNNDYRQNHQSESGDAIKLSSGKFGLNIQHRAYMLGVSLAKNSNGSYGEAINPQKQPDIKSYDISYGAMRSVVELLKPDVPYMYNNQPMFNNPLQFITTGTTLAVQIKTNRDQSGHWNVNANTINGIYLQPLQFNYLEKNEDGTYKYIDDLYKEAMPLYKSNPNFYQTVLAQVKEAVKTQKQALGVAPQDNGMPFPDKGQTIDVASEMGANAQPQPSDTNNVPQTPSDNQDTNNTTSDPTTDLDDMLSSNKSLDDLMNGLK